MLPADKSLSREQIAWRWRILISTYIAYAGYYLTRKVFGIVKSTMAADFGWELSDTADIWTAFLVSYMVGQFICSYVGRQRGARFLLLGGLGISIACNLVFGFANSYWTFMAFMIFNGLVQASGWPGSVGGISQWLRPRERGEIMGVWSTNYLVGNLVVKGLGGYLLGAYGWRWSFWGCTLISFGVWWIIYFWQRDKPEDVGLPHIVEPEPEAIGRLSASQADRVSAREYFRLALNPVILAMGSSYFCIKFLRYLLDSWLPAFLDAMGLEADRASYYSMIFDFAGMGGAIAAGFVLDRYLRGNWALLCFVMGLGMIAGYVIVLQFGGSPVAQAVAFGLVGFMIYGPDTVMSGAAAVQVAGEKNGVAVAGLVNGIGSLGPIVQEQVVKWILRGRGEVSMEDKIAETNELALAMSVVFAVLMFLLMLRLRAARKAQEAEP